jgi:cytochrome c556
MKIRKGYALVFSALGLAGFGLAVASDDEPTKLHKTMEEVQVKNAFIVKNMKTAAVFKKNQKEIAESAKKLAELGKSVRGETEPAKEQKKEQKDWETLMDAYVKASEDFATEVAKADMTQPKAKDAFKTVTATCAACHKDFRPED